MHMLIFGSILFLSVVIARPFTDAFYYTKTIDFLRRALAARRLFYEDAKRKSVRWSRSRNQNER